MDLDSLAEGAGYAVALAFGSLDYQVDAAVVGNRLVQREGEGCAGAGDGGAGRSLDTFKGGRVQHQGAAEFHDPEVETLEEVQTGDLGLGA